MPNPEKFTFRYVESHPPSALTDGGDRLQIPISVLFQIKPNLDFNYSFPIDLASNGILFGIKPNLDCNYSFPIDLVPNGIQFGIKPNLNCNYNQNLV